MDARRSRSSSSRSSAPGSPAATLPAVAPAGGGARAVGRPVVVARWLDETDQARALLRSGPGSASARARDIGPAVERAARAAGWSPAQFLEHRGDARGGRADWRAAPRRGARPLLHELGRSLHRCPRSERRSSGASTPRARSSTRRRRARRAAVAPSASRTTGCATAGRARRLGAGGARSRSRSSRCATAATSSRSAPRRERA